MGNGMDESTKGSKMGDPLGPGLYPVPTKQIEKQNKDRKCSCESLVASQAHEATADSAKGLQHQCGPAHLLPTV